MSPGRAARPAGARPVTLAQVARHAGVSVASASFVLSGRAGSTSSGSAETKAKVRAAAEELGYIPNRTARAMRTGRGGGIVLALGTLGDPWGVKLARQVRGDALAHELSTLVLTDERWFQYLSGASADAAFVTSVDWAPDGLELTRRLAESTNTGIVGFSTTLEAADGLDVVSSSPLAAVADAYRRLRARHDTVHMLAPRPREPRGLGRGEANSGDGEDPEAPPPRTAAFLSAARDHGDEPVSRLVHPVPRRSRDIFRLSLDWLTGPDRPRAVICYTGYQAVALQLAAERLGLTTPDELEIIAIGDVPDESQYFGPISYYGVDDVFTRISAVLVDRARERSHAPGVRHVFDWEFFPGATTLEPAETADHAASDDPKD